MRKYEVLIFITGAVTLALEVLASRIMTPYFGVSLYIWAGILSITLTFLAVGYGLGGRRAARRAGEGLETLYLAAPLVSAAAIVAAAAIFPVLFPPLSQGNLVAGSFVGACVLLALPLIALSAMNPLLIGLQRTLYDAGDAGAGRVFFISTVGSVAGVLATAFLIIPAITNFRAILLLAAVLCAVTAGYVPFAATVPAAARRWLLVGSAVVAAAAGGLALARDAYLHAAAAGEPSSLVFTKEAEYTSVFGNIKVVRLASTAGERPEQRLFLQDGLIQNRTTMDHVSASPYTYALWALARAAAPEPERALVLGLGAGIVADNLRDSGAAVVAVDINRDVLAAATAHFGFDPAGIEVRIEDARPYVRDCPGRFDVIVVDLFLGDNVPDYLLTREFFQAAAGCLTARGAVVMNAFFDERDDEPNRLLLATLRSALPKVVVYKIPAGNTLVVATGAGNPMADAATVAAGMPAELAGFVRGLLATATEVTDARVAGARPVGDDHNIFSVLFSAANMRERQAMAGQLPPWLLVN